MKDLKQLKKDFSFVQDYGYEYGYDLKHYVYPSVVFINKNNKQIQIGFNYEEGRMYAIYYRSEKLRDWEEILDHVEFNSRKYSDQVEKAKNALKEFLNQQNNVN